MTWEEFIVMCIAFVFIAAFGVWAGYEIGRKMEQDSARVDRMKAKITVRSKLTGSCFTEKGLPLTRSKCGEESFNILDDVHHVRIWVTLEKDTR